MIHSVTTRLLSFLLFVERCLSLTVNVPLGSSLVLPCLPDNAPHLSESTMSWTHTPLPPPNSTTTTKLLYPATNSSHDWTLVISKLGKADEGTYECSLEGWTEDDMNLKLKKVYSVFVQDNSEYEQTQRVTAEAESSVTLPCFTPHSAPRVAWYRETKDGKRTRLVPEVNALPPKTDWSITLNYVTEVDSGIYHCEWEEGKRHRVGLEVQAPPTSPPSQCSGHTTPWEECPEVSRSGKAILGESLTEFSLKLYSHLRKSVPSDNLLFSPISIASVLAHLLLGARGKTRSEMESALCLPSSFSCIHEEMRVLREDLSDGVAIASNLYYNPELKLDQMFIDQSQRLYDAVPKKLTNSSEENTKMINNWVAEKTQQRIKELIDSVPLETQLVLLNAVYFYGKWKTTFDNKIKQAPFVTLSGDIVQVPVLYSEKYRLALWHSQDLKAQVAVFPLSGNTRLFLLLPQFASFEKLQEMESRMDEKSIKNLVEKTEKLPTQLAEVTLPKIKLDIQTDLADLLDKIGLSDLFNFPNLCGLSSADANPPLVLTDARHRSFLSLTEKGVEAGAATAVVFSRSYQSFSALRSFVLMLWSDQAGTPIFLGRVTKP